MGGGCDPPPPSLGLESDGRYSLENVGRENFPLPAQVQCVGAWKLTDNGQINRRKTGLFTRRCGTSLQTAGRAPRNVDVYQPNKRKVVRALVGEDGDSLGGLFDAKGNGQTSPSGLTSPSRQATLPENLPEGG